MSAFIVFFGRGGSSDLERQLDTVKIAIGGVVLARAGQAGFSRLYGVTNDEEAAAAFRAKGAAILPARTEPFHFGQELSRIIHEKKLDRVCTIGAGAGALLQTSELRALREDLESSEAVVLSNNSYSADLVAFTPASALDAIDLPATDNPLPRRLHQQAGLSSRQMEKSAASLLDVDTPTDAALLVRHPACPDELREMPAWQDILADRINRSCDSSRRPTRSSSSRGASARPCGHSSKARPPVGSGCSRRNAACRPRVVTAPARRAARSGSSTSAPGRASSSRRWASWAMACSSIRAS